ncbi:hypothetical protein NQ318_002343 [Aromia moschata]|uniref:Uncharacterized protein n=1 Tax=Aromia moschata TaxID=1265417 RepID=A0AAV8XGL5_9CUCU|nr:hypothetical protein NQ318_002343 [Aromia moschata]
MKKMFLCPSHLHSVVTEMGARQSKRSVDITTTPKKGESESVAEGEGKLEKIGDADVKAASNGAVCTEIEFADVVIKQERRSRYAKYSILSILTAAFPSLRLVDKTNFVNLEMSQIFLYLIFKIIDINLPVQDKLPPIMMLNLTTMALIANWNFAKSWQTDAKIILYV